MGNEESKNSDGDQYVYDDDDWDDIEAIFRLNRNKRLIKYHYKWLNWAEHVEMLQYIGNFKGSYQMDIDSFNTLLEAIQEDITVDFA
eukprot:3595050-Ditylum_brightwellii.AAC.1